MSKLIIGPHMIDPPLFLAPLEELTDAALRCAIRNLGGCGATISEMVRADGIVGRDKRELLLLRTHDEERPVGIQLYGSRPQPILEAANQAIDHGADFIDLNVGCPARKITGKLAGAGLLRELEHLHRLLDEIVPHLAVPVTLKTRLGWQTGHPTLEEVIRIAHLSGISVIFVHARFRDQRYDQPADWPTLLQAIEQSPVPIVGNGDLDSPEKTRAAFFEKRISGLMIGRGALINPWIFRQTVDPDFLVTTSDKTDFLQGYLQNLKNIYDRRSVYRRLKKFLGWFDKTGSTGRAMRLRLSDVDDLDALEELLNSFYPI